MHVDPKASCPDYTTNNELLVLKIYLNSDVVIKPGSGMLINTGLILGFHPSIPMVVGAINQGPNAILSVKDAYLDNESRKLIVYIRNMSPLTTLVLSKEKPFVAVKTAKLGMKPVMVVNPVFIRQAPTGEKSISPIVGFGDHADLGSNCCYLKASTGDCRGVCKDCTLKKIDKPLCQTEGFDPYHEIEVSTEGDSQSSGEKMEDEGEDEVDLANEMRKDSNKGTGEKRANEDADKEEARKIKFKSTMTAEVDDTDNVEESSARANFLAFSLQGMRKSDKEWDDFFSKEIIAFPMDGKKEDVVRIIPLSSGKNEEYWAKLQKATTSVESEEKKSLIQIGMLVRHIPSIL